MPCIEAFVEIIWPSISSALEYFLQTTAGGALTRVRDWVIHRVCGEATPAPVILQLPNSPRSIVGIEEVLPKFRSFLDDDTCKIIGIYDRDGIGKTTLLQEIKNEFFERKSRRFDLVIFVQLYKDIPIDLIQRKILDRLGLDKESSDPKYKIFNALREKKFLLLLDNLWGKVNLGEIGIPVPPYLKEGSKIAFTTQSAEVCNDMGAARWKLKMPPLSEEKSWELFCQNLGMGENRLTESTRAIAKEVALKCKGLPRALITVGRAMADVTDSREWEAALATLQGRAGGLRGMNEGFLRNLKCSFVPESDNTTIEDLMEYLVGEGLEETEIGHAPLM